MIWLKKKKGPQHTYLNRNFRCLGWGIARVGYWDNSIYMGKRQIGGYGLSNQLNKATYTQENWLNRFPPPHSPPPKKKNLMPKPLRGFGILFFFFSWRRGVKFVKRSHCILGLPQTFHQSFYGRLCAWWLRNSFESFGHLLEEVPRRDAWRQIGRN